jgi:inhibitor of cysteine peptidase
MRDDIEKILDECIDRMNGGESLEDCLAGYPEHAAELRPLLLAARGIRDADLPPVDQRAKAAAKTRLNAALVEKRNEVGVMQRLLEIFTAQRARAYATVSVVLVALIVGVSVYSMMGEGTVIKPSQGILGENVEIDNFSSEAEFISYLAQGEELSTYTSNWRGGGVFGVEDSSQVPLAAADDGTQFSTIEEGSNRVSGTNVQVMGIDEPDIVKTDGMNIYFSREEFSYYYYEFGVDVDIMPREMDSGIQIVGAYPPINMSVLGEIERSGDLLLYEDTLAVFTWDGIYGYDVSDPQNPASVWDITLDDYTSVVAARLYQGKIYLVTQTYIDSYNPVPIRPLEVKGAAVEIDYYNVYYPLQPMPADITLNAMLFDMQSGDLEDSVSFLGSTYSSVVYMSGNAIYVGYSYSADMVPYVFEFFTVTCQGILPDSLIAQINQLDTYDISDAAKMTEIEVIIGEYLASLSGDEMAQVENNIGNALEDYYAQHMREVDRTGIVKIALDGLDITATGSVPGDLLNQFSMDEYNGYLRVATTVGSSFGTYWGLFWINGQSANDIYVLDGNMSVTGAVQDLGLTEQIYSARFIGDKGYVVTYRQVDPFYVLDLSDPANPQLKGELKIPGYSSYLHPISGDRMLGIGQEDWQVKISLFDVQDPEQPAELDKYILDDYWSDVLSTHHAFLLDEAHGIFFLPGGDDGYVFSYAGDSLELVKVISDIQARRAVYIDDYLYVIGDSKIVVLNELDWQIASEIEF